MKRDDLPYCFILLYWMSLKQCLVRDFICLMDVSGKRINSDCESCYHLIFFDLLIKNFPAIFGAITNLVPKRKLWRKDKSNLTFIINR